MPLLLNSAVLSLLLPPAMTYLIALLMLGALIRDKRSPSPTPIFKGDAAISDQDGASWQRAVRLITWGAALFFAFGFLSDILAALFSPSSIPWSKLFAGEAHLALKRWVLLLVLLHGVRLGAQRGWRLYDQAKPIFVFLAVYLIYGIFQRATGIDWVHGFDAKLGANELNSGFYRVRGVMGHPISLAYNLMLFATLIFALIKNEITKGVKGSERTIYFWWGNLALTLILLLLSGSRWPLAVTGLVGILIFGGSLWRYKYWAFAAAAMAGAGIWLEGSLLGRLRELTVQDVALYERIPRLLFWRIHSHMFLDHPWTGVGYYLYDFVADSYYTEAGFGEFREKYAAHNIYLQTLADSGLIGMVGLLGLFAGIFKSAREIFFRGERATLIRAIALATILGGLMQNVLRDSTFLYALWFILALVCSGALQRRTNGNPDE